MLETTLPSLNSTEPEPPRHAEPRQARSDILKSIGIVFAAALLSYLAYRICSSFKLERLSRFPFMGDEGAYFYQNATYYFQSQLTGWNWEKLIQLSQANDLWRVVPLLFRPQLLINGAGHVAVGSWMLFAFMSAAGLTAWNKTGSVWYALACLLAIPTSPSFLSPWSGHGGFHLDYFTSYLVAASIFSLVNSDQTKKTGWVLLSGIFASLAIYSRLVAGGVIVVLCLPVYLFYIVRRIRRSGFAGQMIVSFLAASVPILLLNYHAILINFQSAIQHYLFSEYVTTHLSHMFKSVSESAAFLIYTFGINGGETRWTVLGVFFIAYLILFWKYRIKNGSFGVSLYLAFSFMVMHTFILRIGVDAAFSNYMHPGLYVLAYVPFDIDRSRLPESRKKVHLTVSILFFVICALLITSTYKVGRKHAYRKPDNITAQYVDLQQKIANTIRQNLDPADRNPTTMESLPTFDTLFPGQGILLAVPVANEYVLRFKEPLFRYGAFGSFNVGWDMTYPGKGPSEAAAEAERVATEHLDFAVVTVPDENPQIGYDKRDLMSLDISKRFFKIISKDTKHWTALKIAGEEKTVIKNDFGRTYVFKNIRGRTAKP